MNKLLMIPTKRSDLMAGIVSPDSDAILKVKYDNGFQLFETTSADAIRIKLILSQLSAVRYVDIIPIEHYV